VEKLAAVSFLPTSFLQTSMMGEYSQVMAEKSFPKSKDGAGACIVSEKF
jgi:hypothetical protein